MRHRDERELVFFFVGIQLVLLGVICWNLRYQASTSEAVITRAKQTFLRETPRLLNRAGLPVRFESIEPGVDGLADVVFAATGVPARDELSKPIGHLLRLRYSVTDDLRTGNLLIYGVGFHGAPVGRVIVRRPESQPAATVGLIIDDFGYDRGNVVNGFLQLPPNITLSVIPGHRYSREIARVAHARGFEVMIHMPMEPEQYEGGEEDFILMSNMPSKEIIARLNKAFEELPDAAGLNNHEGSRATQNPNVMQTVLEILRDRDMYFVDSYTSPESIGYLLAQKMHIPSGKRSVFLDNQQDTTAIRTQLNTLIHQARSHGTAIGIGHAKAQTLAVLQEYIPYYQARGVRFVPISELIQHPMLAEQAVSAEANQ